MSSKMAVSLVGARRWSLTDEKTGELREGISLYIGRENDGSDGERIDPDYLGLKVMKMSAPSSVYQRLALQKASFPLDCELVISLKLGAEGKAVIQVHDVEI